MGDTTTNRGYRKPLSSDPAANLTSYFRNLADDVDVDVQALITLLQGAWTTYTPTLTNVTLGNGTLLCHYRQVGKTVDYAGSLTWGSTTAFTAAPSLTIPVAALNTALGVGTSIYNDSSAAANRQGGQVELLGTTAIRFYKAAADLISASTPFTWAVGDVLKWSIRYEAA